MEKIIHVILLNVIHVSVSLKKKYKVTGNNIFPHYSNAQIQTL